MADVKRVYTFGNKEAEGNGKMRELLGGKGANLAEMNLIGIPVPPGFTITTDVCSEYYRRARSVLSSCCAPRLRQQSRISRTSQVASLAIQTFPCSYQFALVLVHQCLV